MAGVEHSECQKHNPAPEALLTVSAEYPSLASEEVPLIIAPVENGAHELTAPLLFSSDGSFGVLTLEMTTHRGAAALPPRLARTLEAGQPRWRPAAVSVNEDGDVDMDDGDLPTERTAKRPRATYARLNADCVFPPWIARKFSARGAVLYTTDITMNNEDPLDIEYSPSSISPDIVGAGVVEDDTTATPRTPSPAPSTPDVGRRAKRTREATIEPSDRVLRARRSTPRPETRQLRRQEGTEGRKMARGEAPRTKVVRFDVPVGGKGQACTGGSIRELSVFGEERRDFRIICASVDCPI